ncbi:class I adenylate-forming enzyme family protein [Azonexus sp.]|uniref:class I adenylate-forming enzyme family protein n=1 Tax=Azonexus sp. TaxID=1872668 RepID=UPI0035B3A5BA
MEKGNLADLLTRQAELRPDAAALLHRGNAVSFAQLDDAVWRATVWLGTHGVKPGDVAGLSLCSELAIVVAMLALARMGATVFSLPVGQPAPLRDEMAVRAGIDLLICDKDAEGAPGIRRLEFALRALQQVDADNFRHHIATPEAPWMILFGSGTTGRPKGFQLSHRQQLARCASSSEWLELTPGDRISSLMHFNFSNTKTRFLEGLLHGATFLVPDRELAEAVAQCRRAGVSVLHATVFHLERILAGLPASASGHLDFLRLLTVGSSTISDGLRQRVAARLTANLRIHYGTNESGLLTYATPPRLFASPGTVGRTAAGVELEIVGPDDRPLPAGSTGLVRARRPGLIDGYRDDPAATGEAFRNGWFHTGDLGRIDADGELIYCGRADQMMIMNGINIYPEEIERVALQHPAVADAAALPLRSPIHQDVPVCAVALHPGRPADDHDLFRFVQDRLGFKGPKKIFFLDRIPRNEQGKLNRAALVAQIERLLRE